MIGISSVNRVTLADALCANAAAAVVFALICDALAEAEVTRRNDICLGAVPAEPVVDEEEDVDDDDDDDDDDEKDEDEDRVDDAANDAGSA